MIALYIGGGILLFVVGFLVGSLWVARNLAEILSRMSPERIDKLSDQVFQKRQERRD